MPSDVKHSVQEPIAVIGMAFQFPGGANTDDEFWDLLMQRRCVSREFPKDRGNIDLYHDPTGTGMSKVATRNGHFLDKDIREFDPRFFAISQAEASSMDPQHRALMETVYHAHESAGLTMNDIAGSRTSVHVGCFGTDYHAIQCRDQQNIAKYSATGGSGCILSNRISWFFDLLGPSMTIDTACSSSMVAFDLACKGLWDGSVDSAIVGGANLIQSPDLSIMLSNMSFLSPDGRCYSFDHRGNGYARGEGVAALLLKPLSRAIRDKNPVRALVRAVGTNQDGYTKGGLTQPSMKMQAALINETYRKAGLGMAETRFFEAHGTATSVGDPIEARAVGECFRRYHSTKDPIYVGALKSNIGHLEGCSGLAGIIKAILAVERGVIPPNANFEQLNPQIDAEFFHLQFPTEPVPWPNHGQGIRRASVNSFGFGGTNGHVVLEDVESYLRYSTLASNGTNGRLTHPNGLNGHTWANDDAPKLLLLNAADESGCHRSASSINANFHLADDEKNPALLDDTAFTLNTRRTKLPWKSFVVVQALEELKKFEDIISRPIRRDDALSNLAFVFTGQGAQWMGMGSELLDWPIFVESVLRSQACIKKLGCSWSLIDILSAHKDSFPISNPKYSQLLTTVVQIGLVDLFASIDVLPTVVLGHSSGEIASAYCAGLISQPSAIKISYYRGVLAAKLAERDGESHSMLSVGLSPAELQVHLDELIDGGHCLQNTFTISCINSPLNVTVSAPQKELNILAKYLTQKDVFVRQLQVPLGYHSPQMRQISSEYMQSLGSLESGSKIGKTRMISSVTGCFLDTNVVTTPAYWDENLVSQVNFAGAASRCFYRSTKEEPQMKLDQSHLDELLVSGILEIGPHSTLKAPLRQILDAHGRSKEVFYISALSRGKSAKKTVLEACGRLYCENVPLNVALLTSWCRTSPTTPKVLTQLPKYPFDHSTLNWEESRINRDLRLQSHGYNQFLGIRMDSGALLDARWRLILRTDEQPWIKDHVINGANIYPGAGMLVMALEAAKQLTWEKPPKAFVFENVEFVAPILLSDTPSGTEVEICLVPMRGDKRSSPYQFRIATWRRDASCEEVCHGLITADYGRVPSEMGQDDNPEARPHIWTRFERAEHTCTRMVNDFYATLRSQCGAEFGPTFRRLQEVSYNDEGDVIASLSPYEDDCIAHPVMLDAAFQAAQAMPSGTRVRTMVPRRVSKLWLSASGIGKEQSSKELIHARATMPTRRTAISSFSVLRPASHEVGVIAHDFEYTAVCEHSDAEMSGGEVKHLAAHMIWRPDPDLLINGQLQDYCNRYRDTRDDPVEYFHNWTVACMALGSRALAVLETDQQPTPELARYVSWLKATIASTRSSKLPTITNLLDTYIEKDDALGALCDQVAAQKAGEFYAEVGKSLSKILTGELDPLAVVFKDEQLVKDYYDEMLYESRPLKPLQAYVDVLVHKRPDLKFLEIGAGTGGSTNVMLEVLSDWAGPRYGQYVFTDIGPSFLEKARARFSNKMDMQFRPLNIERDPLEQGFSEHEFDVIVADMVLHATSDLSNTLQNVRKLLKPGGKLILKEVTATGSILAGFVFGLLPGWWLSVEKSRVEAQSPCVDEEGWDLLLRSNHFSGNDLVMRDYEADDCHSWSYLISTATDMDSYYTNGISRPSSPLIVAKDGSAFQAELAERIGSALAGTSAETFTLDEVANITDLTTRDLIVLLESEEPVLVDPTQMVFTSLQKILCSARSVLWMGQSSYTTSPSYGIITGLIRVLRVENKSTNIVTLALETQDMARIVTHATTIFETTRNALAHHLDAEPEYLEQSNLLHINRIVSSKAINGHIFRRTAHPVLPQTVGNSNLRLGIRALGLLDTLQFSEETSEHQQLAPNEIIVRVQSIGVNFKDCLTLLGRIDTDALGSECAGTVVEAGHACGAIAPGTRVIACVFDAYRSFVRTTIDRVIMVPDWMSFPQAASILTAFCTAHFSLLHVARLQENETVLIHAASGGTGQAAIQVAQSAGAKIFATVGSLAKKQLLMEVYGIPESHIFYSRDTSFADRVMDATHGEGVDVVLNSLAGKQLQASWETIADFGRFIEIGRSDIDSRKTLPMHPFRKNASFTGIDLTLVMGVVEGPPRRKHATKILREVMDQINIGAYKPVHPIQEYDIGDIEHALRFIQSGKSSGKIVVNVSQDSVVPVVQGPNSSYRFRPDATYVICGGLGGLGRSIAKWLCDRGARNLILLSRSGLDAPKARAEVERLRTQGVSIECPKCDISDLASLKSALSACSHLPPIRGCFQGAMVLRDSTFAKMTYAQWTESTLPKVQGSWNLHQVMAGSDLDFFILLSSVGAIFGNGGQSNYSAGNTFQDALARYRVSRGEKAISLNLGMILGEGYVAENNAIQERLIRQGQLAPIRIEEFLAMLDYCCEPNLKILSPDDCQLVTGLMLPAQLRAEGKDVPSQLLQPMLRCVAQIPVRESVKTSNEASGDQLIADFRETENAGDAANIATKMLQIKTSRLLGMQVQDIQATSQIEHYGVDSLVAIELRNWISKELAIDVAVFEILGGMSLLELGTLIAQRRPSK